MSNNYTKGLFFVKQAEFERSYFIPGCAKYLNIQEVKSHMGQIYHSAIDFVGKFL